MARKSLSCGVYSTLALKGNARFRFLNFCPQMKEDVISIPKRYKLLSSSK